MHIQNPTKATIRLTELPEFISHHGLAPSQVIATGLEINGDKVEVQYLKSADYPRTKLDEKLAIPVAWTPGYSYLGNIQVHQQRELIVVEGEPRFMAHPHMTRFIKVFRQMFARVDKPIADLYCVTPTQALETAVGTWDTHKAFRQPKGVKFTNIRLVEDGVLATVEGVVNHALMTGDGIPAIKDEDWALVAGDNGHDRIILLGRFHDKKIVATTELGKQFVVDISNLTPQNRKARTGIPVEDGNFFYGVTGGQFLAYLTRKEGAQREQRLIFTPKTGKHAPQIASQLQLQ